MILLLYILFPLLCILAIPQVSQPGAFAQRVVFGLALYESLLFAIGVALGLTHHLTTLTYTVVTSCTAFLLLMLSWLNGVRFDFKPAFRWVRTRRGMSTFLLIILMAIVFALEISFDAFYGTKHNDGLIYHIPRIIFWIHQHSFDAWITPSWQQVGLPVGADVILGHKVFLGTGWRGISFVTGLLSLGAIACVYLAALDFRFTRWHATMTAILFGSFPIIGLRIWSANSDITAAFPVLASYVALRQIREPKIGLAVFLILNGIAVACKPTIVPHALLLGSIALYQCRREIFKIRSFTLPCTAVLMASIIVVASYWPVYQAFLDFQGGGDGRGHEVGSIAEFMYSVRMSAAHWLLEPLGYITPIMPSWVKRVATSFYSIIGASFSEIPRGWEPWPGQDVGSSGLASILALPALFIGLPSRVRVTVAVVFLLGFIPLSGILHYMPYSARFFTVLLAGYALLWGGSKLFLRGKSRWLLTGIVTLNVLALLGVVSCRFYVDEVINSKPGGVYYYIADDDRKIISNGLKGSPLLVISGGEFDALLAGPDINFSLRYIDCPSDGDWNQEFRNASVNSNWLAIVHNGQKSILPGSVWHRPGSQTHSANSEVSMQALEDALTRSGWRLYRRKRIVDLWKFNQSV